MLFAFLNRACGVQPSLLQRNYKYNEREVNIVNTKHQSYPQWMINWKLNKNGQKKTHREERIWQNSAQSQYF